MYDKEQQDRLRRLWRMYWDRHDRLIAEYCEEHGVSESEAIYSSELRLPPFPPYLEKLICGAKTRKGTPCKLTSLYRSGRCKFHGGLSTGPKTEEGKRRAAENGKACRFQHEEADPMKTS